MRMRLIDAESLKELFPDNGEGSWTYNATVKAYIDALPSIQPDIIRCKDCEWWTKQENSIQGRCALHKMYPSGNWYCGTARRRGEQE